MSAAALLTLAVAGCGSDTPESTPGSPPPQSAAAAPIDARDELAGLAALALDRRYVALYSLDVGDGAPRDVVATVANDGSWRVDIPRGALGGTTDVSIVRLAAGVYQCGQICVLVADKGERVPRRYDPRVQRLFRQWLPVFTDRQAALAVSAVRPLAGAQGTCYSVDSVSASLDAPVDVGIYCYAADGLLTAARVSFGVLTLVKHVAAPAAVGLPAPEVAGAPMGMAAPPPPPVTQPPALQPSAVVAPG